MTVEVHINLWQNYARSIHVFSSDWQPALSSIELTCGMFHGSHSLDFSLQCCSGLTLMIAQQSLFPSLRKTSPTDFWFFGMWIWGNKVWYICINNSIVCSSGSISFACEFGVTKFYICINNSIVCSSGSISFVCLHWWCVQRAVQSDYILTV